MYEALQKHNEVLRSTATEHNGYEVKIIGDALMLAFAQAVDAVRFGSDAQLRLVKTEWPRSLCEYPLCRPVECSAGVPLWNGLRVRIGVNWGEARAELNIVNGRFDYFGPTVNTAARVEAALKDGGLTGVTQAVVDEVGPSAMGEFFTAPFGEREMKGVAQPVAIFVVLPPALAGRWGALQHVWSDSDVSSNWTQPSPRFDQTPGTPVTYFDTDDKSGSRTLDGSRSLETMSHISPGRGSPAHRKVSWHTTLTRRQAPNSTGLKLGLRASEASCATVRGAFGHLLPGEGELGMTHAVMAVETAALRTQGQVVCVVSAVCLGWNAGISCSEHVAQCTHFVSLLNKTPRVHIGATSGGVLSGNMAGRRRRYVTVAGTCVELSGALAEAAVLRGVRFMVAGDVGRRFARESSLSRGSE